MYWLWITTWILLPLTLAYQNVSRWTWLILLSGLLLVTTFYSSFSWVGISLLWLVSLAFMIPLNVRALRREKISKKLLLMYRKHMPSLSATEVAAIEAGDVTWEADVFAGSPRWSKLLKQKTIQLSSEEQAFLDGPVEELCAMIDDWQITHALTDLPEEMWTFIKKHGFFGLIIPKEYGGLAFSETAHNAILVKLYSRSISVASTVSVPNSLGPAELLIKYGTQTQRDYYLPRLARGEDIPCFALTNPNAGSDAAAIPDTGIVCRDEFEGKTVTGIRLNWDKRYITLSPVATVIGLAFRLFDPEHLLGDEEDIGITLALIPRDVKGLTIGRRHYPLNAAFLNGPIQGEDVFIPLDWIIGGAEKKGQGWGMLMECLSAGRAISLPSSAMGGAKAATLACSAYARVRTQFGLPIGLFGGIQDPLARMAGYTYMISSMVKFTAAAIDSGHNPSVASAIVKYHATELSRSVITDAMDIQGGKAICLGPKNVLGRGYQSLPIGITVEGANILTRSLIIFGQGLIRCHPHVHDELEAATNMQLAAFDKSFFAHVSYIFSISIKSIGLAVTRGLIALAPKSKARRYYKWFSRFSASFALMAEVSMLALRHKLKRREMLSARLGDVLSKLYIGSAVLKKFHDDGEPEEDLELVTWCCQTLIYEIEQSMLTTMRNFPVRWAALLMRVMVFPTGGLHVPPSDELSANIARSLLTQNSMRTRLCEGVHLSEADNNPLGEIEAAFAQVLETEALDKRVQEARKEGDIEGLGMPECLQAALDASIIDEEEFERLLKTENARQAVIAVDDFSDDELRR